MSKNYQHIISTSLCKLALLCGLFMLCGISDVAAQGYEKIYGEGSLDEGRAIVQTPDEAYAIAGTYAGEIFVIKTDHDGNIVWEYKHDGPNFNEFGYDMTLAEDGGFVVVGTSQFSGTRDAIIIKIDKNGQEVWERVIGGLENEPDAEAFGVDNTSDGGFVVTGYQDANDDNQDTYLAKISASGMLEWERTFDFSETDTGFDVIESSDGGFMIVGNVRTNDSIFFDVQVIKTDETGELVWAETWGGNENDEGFSIVETADNLFAVTGYTQTNSNGWDIYLIKFDIDGDEIYTKTFGETNDDQGLSIETSDDGGFIIVGSSDISTINGDVVLLKTNSDGDEIWTQYHGRSFASLSNDIGYAVNKTLEGGYILAGNFTKVNSIFDTDIYLVKTDSLGNIYSNYIEGNVFRDLNNNCILDDSDYGMEDWIVVAEGEYTFYGTSDADGNYSILVDTGDYNVYLANPGYWESCVDNYSINFDSFYDTLQVDFAIHPNIPCPYMEVDIATAFTRPCEETVYYVNYCNHGTVQAEDAYIEITLDESLEFVSSTVPAVSQADGLYDFALGNVPAMYCGQFTFVATLSCDADIQESTCVAAHIFPDENCFDLNPSWDGSSIKVSGECDSDSIRFQIENIGDNNMESFQNYFVVEEHLIFSQGDFNLGSGEVKTLNPIPASGNTYRLIAEQSNGHPGYSFPTVAIEGCNNGVTQNSYGQVNQFTEDDADPFLSVDCHENIANVSISQIEGYPKGYIQDTFYVAQSTDIEYQLNFQNTDLLTANRVVLIDSIPDQLDAASIRPGASSHPYEYKVYNNGVVQFVFEDLELPSSSVDEKGSIGFVKFRLSQKTDIIPGTMILNRAATYLQFETPLRSDQVLHTVTDDLNNVLVTNIVEYPTAGFEGIAVFPNPFSTACSFEINGEQLKEVEFAVFDMMGRVVREESISGQNFTFDRNGLPGGTYVFRLTTEGNLLSTGKLLIQ